MPKAPVHHNLREFVQLMLSWLPARVEGGFRASNGSQQVELKGGRIMTFN